MSDPIEPKLAKWPFYLGDGVLLAAAYYLIQQNRGAMGHWEIALAVLSIAAGAVLCITPFVMEYRAGLRMAEARSLTTVVAQVQRLEEIAEQISSATGRWQQVQEHAGKTAGEAKGIADRMATEVRGFTEFMQRANDSEKATLRLETEKLRRAEADWLQVLVRMLDHVFAMYLAAARSGQPNLTAQVGHLQNACRDAARRVGLVPFAANESDPFDPQRHQSVEEGTKPGPDATVAETLATGYTFQGQLIRPALVRLRSTQESATTPAESEAVAAVSVGEQDQLPLEQSGGAA